MLNTPINFELRVRLEGVPHSGFGVVARSPRAVGKPIGGQVFDHRIQLTVGPNGRTAFRGRYPDRLASTRYPTPRMPG